jgi:hypothetical protein
MCLGGSTAKALLCHVGRALYMFLILKCGELGEKELLRWEIAPQRETILGQFPLAVNMGVLPAERWLIRCADQALDVRPTSGGDWRPLVSNAFRYVGGSTDGNRVLYHGVDSTRKHGPFRVATVGGQPERLGDFPTNSPAGSLEISPDRRKIMVALEEFENAAGYELWSETSSLPRRNVDV